jgi:oligoendopeptidase F
MQQARDTKSAMNDAATAQRDLAPGGSLPAWDLSDLYPSPDSPAVMADLARAEETAKGFAHTHAGTLASLSGAALAAVIAEYERIQEMLGRVASYAQLLFAGDSSDPVIGRFYQTVNERVTAISSDLIFFSLELNRVDDGVLEAKLTGRGCAICGCSVRTSSVTSWRS